jgi:hypothetical protein
MTTTILHILRYPLPRNDPDPQTVRRHYDSDLTTGLPCSGIARTFPRALVCGPIEYQGLGIPNLYTTQGISHIERILNTATSTTT